MIKPIACLLLLFGNALLAQNTLNFNNLDHWKSPAPNWEIVGAASGSYLSDKLNTNPGQGLLHCKAKDATAHDLHSNFEHGDVRLSFDFMLPKGSNSGIYLQGQYEVQLYDSWGIKTPHQHDCGAIYERWDPARGKGNEGYQGHAPKVNANLAPGLWQHMEIHFIAPKFDAQGRKTENARFEQVTLNGIELHRNVIVLAPTRGADAGGERARGPIRIQGDHGQVAFRNFSVEMLDKEPVKMQPVTYRYWEGKFDKIPDALPTAKPKNQGTLEAINYRQAEKNNDFLLVFDGNISVPETAEYHINLPATGTCKLLLDGKPLINKGLHLWRNEPNSAKTTLTAGLHSYQLLYTKTFGWGGRALGLYLKRDGTEPQALHAYKSLPDPDPVGLIEVKASDKPTLVRSFVMHNGAKRTHAINVGELAGVHYAYDLQKAALLSAWKGRFLNTTEMWFERGEPQLAEPLGVALPLDGKTAVFNIADINNVSEQQNLGNDLTYTGYHFNSERRPIFQYQYKGESILEHIRPNEQANGLHRNVIFNKNIPNTYIRAGEGNMATDLGDGLYQIDNQYIKTQSPNAKIVNIGNTKALMIPLESTNVAYEVIW
jgi:hypothetical protein